MRKNIYKILSMTMASALVISGASYAGMVNRPQIVIADTQDEAADTIVEEIKKMVSFNDAAVDKDETVYVITDANGNVTKKIVSDHLINKDGSATLTDKTDLDDVENVKTDADYKENADGTIEWDVDGEDVYYQGTTDKALPVDVKVTYYIDGEEINPDDLAGKSGSVRIKFEYTNNTKTTATVGNEQVDMFVPFTMISGTILSSNFTNISVTNGKVINQGDSNIVVGYAFPGLAQDLNLTGELADKVEIPESFEITADVTDFSLMTTVTVGSADLLSSVDVDTATTKDDINAVIDELVSSTDQLKDGSTQLADGAGELKSKYGEYKEGILAVITAIDQINNGADTLNEKMALIVDGAKQIADGVGSLKAAFEGEEGLTSGVSKIADGMVTLDEGIDSLKKSVGTVDDTQTIVGALNALANGANTLSSSIGSTNSVDVAKDAAKETPTTLAGAVKALLSGTKQLSDGIDSLAAGVNGTKNSVGLVDGINSAAAAVGSSSSNEIMKDASTGNPSTLTGGAAAVDAGVGQLVDGMVGMQATINQNIADNNSTITQLTNAITYIKTYGKDPSTGATLTQEQATTMVTTYSNNIAALKGANQALQAVLDQMDEADLTGNLTKLKNGTTALKNGTVQLAQGMEQLSDGAATLKAGVSQLQTGSKALLSGVSKLNSKMGELTKGAKTLADSLNTLNSKMPELQTGVEQLKGGSSQLVTGTDALKSGVSTLYDAIKNQLGTGASSLYDGTVEFHAGLGTLASGTNELNGNMASLSDGTNKLEDGIGSLADGASQLDEGVGKLTDEAIGGAIDSYNDKIIPAIDRIEGTLDAAKEYDIYSQAADNQTSKVKFIYRTASIE